MHGNIATDGRTSLRRKRARQEFECSKCQFKTSYCTLLMKHDRHLHMSDMHQNVKDIKEQSGSQFKRKMRNKDSASGHMTAKSNYARPMYNCSICPYRTQFHTSLTRHNREMHGNMLADSINSPQCNSRSDDGNIGGTVNIEPYHVQLTDTETEAVTNSTERYNSAVLQSSHSEERDGKDHTKIKHVKWQFLQLGEVKVCERKKFACSVCGLMMMHYLGMMKHCTAVHGGGLVIQMKPHQPPVCTNEKTLNLHSTAADSGSSSSERTNSTELPSQNYVTTDCGVSEPVGSSQSPPNLYITAVEMSGVVTDRFDVATCIGDSRRHVTNDKSVGELMNVTVRECSCCRLRFNDLSALQSHHCTSSDSVHHPHQQQKSADKTVDTSLLRCPTCRKTFSSVGDLYEHMENSSVGKCGKSFLCQSCGRCFVTSYHLGIHAKQHSGEKPQQCEVCGRRFSTLKTLKIHYRLHEGTRPNTCHVCGQRCSSSAAFRRHATNCRETRPEKLGRCGRSVVGAVD